MVIFAILPSFCINIQQKVVEKIQKDSSRYDIGIVKIISRVGLSKKAIKKKQKLPTECKNGLG